MSASREHPRIRSTISSLVLLAATVVFQKPAWSVTAFEFVPISGEPAATSFNLPGLADDGVVVYQQVRSVVIGDGGPLTIITGGTHGPFASAASPAISDDGGIVAFIAQPFDPDPAVYVARPSASPGAFNFAKIADTNDGLEKIDSSLNLDVNNDGTVVFAARDGQVRYVLAGGGGPVTELARSGSIHDDPAINAAGRVAFRDGLTTGGAAILEVGPDPPVIIARGSTGQHFEGIGRFGITDAAAVAFISTVRATSVRGIFLGDGSSTSTLVDSTGPYDAFNDVSIHDLDQIAFTAELDVNNVTGLYRGPDPIRDKVIAPGDVLFGKVVSSVHIGRDAMNAARDIAFKVVYTDETEQIVRAHPLSKFDNLPPDVLDPHVQLSTGGGTGVDISTPVATTGGFASSGDLQLSFDLRFQSRLGQVAVSLGARELGRFSSGASGPITITNIDPRSLFAIGGGVPPEIPLTFSLTERTGLGATVQVDDVLLTSQKGTTHFREEFTPAAGGSFPPHWQIDTSDGGFITLNAISTGLAGDYNNNGLVEQADLDLALTNWGKNASPAPAGWMSDLPIGVIDQEELDGVLVQWGAAAAVAAIPEPITLLLLCVCGVAANGFWNAKGPALGRAGPLRLR